MGSKAGFILEVKSAFWQKLFILPISLLFCGMGVASCLVPFVPALHTNSRTGQVNPLTALDVVMAPALGLLMFAGGFCLWWTVIKYSICADNEGITQTNGFFSQSVRWADVASYYMEPNRRFHSESRLHVEPVLLDANGKIIFRGFAHLLVSTRKIVAQRRELWQFVEAQLNGKKVDAPSRELTPEIIAARSLEVNWKEKSLLWKLARITALILYGVFWFSLSMVPIYYVVSRDISAPKPWGVLLLLPMFFGPLLPHIIWLQFKKRRIAKELKMQESSGDKESSRHR